MSAPDPQPRDIALELETPELADELEAQSKPSTDEAPSAESGPDRGEPA